MHNGIRQEPRIDKCGHADLGPLLRGASAWALGQRRDGVRQPRPLVFLAAGSRGDALVGEAAFGQGVVVNPASTPCTSLHIFTHPPLTIRLEAVKENGKLLRLRHRVVRLYNLVQLPDITGNNALPVRTVGTMVLGLPVEDLPQMWEKPSCTDILDALQSLELNPPIWNHRRRRSDILVEQESLASQHKAAATRYISSVVSSPLGWLQDDEQREEIWTQASKRMSERCGRTAMGEVVRSWPFEGDDVPYEPFELVIREPALTGDSLGFKTWGSSYVLSQYLPQLGSSSLFGLFDDSLGKPRPDVLELGSGTGLLGLAAAALWKVPVVLSDLPNIVSNLKANADRNEGLVNARGGSLKIGPLTWGGSGEEEVDPALFGKPHQFKIVLAADPLYDDNHPGLLASAIAEHLALDAEARAVVMVPQRDETTIRLRDALKQALLKLERPIFCDEEKELAGQDDWVQDEDGGLVKCWLGVFSRR